MVDFHTLEAMFLLTTTEENEAAPLLLFCELGISSQDQFCLKIEVNLWRKKGKQIFSKTVRANKFFVLRLRLGDYSTILSSPSANNC